jgi:hypothetical protein
MYLRATHARSKAASGKGVAASGPLLMSIINAKSTINALPPTIALKIFLGSDMVSKS